MIAAGKCSQHVELSGENINITFKPDGTHIAVGNRVSIIYVFLFIVNVFLIYWIMDTKFIFLFLN